MKFNKMWIEDRVYHVVNQICSKLTLHEVGVFALLLQIRDLDIDIDNDDDC